MHEEKFFVFFRVLRGRKGLLCCVSHIAICFKAKRAS